PMPFAILADDVNADGHVDIVTAYSASGDLSVLAGDGAGHFTPAGTYAAGKTPVALAALSFDGAARSSRGGARRDLAVLSNGMNKLALFQAASRGMFEAARNFPSPRAPFFGASGDFNRDGRTDFAVVDNLSNK